MTRVGGFFALLVVLKYFGVSNLSQAQYVSAFREAVAAAAENAAASAQQCAALVGAFFLRGKGVCMGLSSIPVDCCRWRWRRGRQTEGEDEEREKIQRAMLPDGIT